jgi:hypothetical protein
MKKLTGLLLILFSFTAFSQAYQEESSFENEDDSFKYDPSYDGQLEYPSGPEVYEDVVANESMDEEYLNEDE